MEKTESRTVSEANLKPFAKGETGNPNGRPKGQRNYSTIYREALIKIAEANDKTPEEIETMMEQTGIKKALKGDFQFFKDIRDRIHGKPVEKRQIEVTEVKPLLGGKSHGSNNDSDTEAPEAQEED